MCRHPPAMPANSDDIFPARVGQGESDTQQLTRKKPSYSPFYRLFDRDPYHGLL